MPSLVMAKRRSGDSKSHDHSFEADKASKVQRTTSNRDRPDHPVATTSLGNAANTISMSPWANYIQTHAHTLYAIHTCTQFFFFLTLSPLLRENSIGNTEHSFFTLSRRCTVSAKEERWGMKNSSHSLVQFVVT